MRRRLQAVTWHGVAHDETDLLKVGFVFSGRVMLVELKVV